jgi:hypothetical protein
LQVILHTPNAGPISVYTLTGRLIYTARKEAGDPEKSVFPENVLFTGSVNRVKFAF